MNSLLGAVRVLLFHKMHINNKPWEKGGVRISLEIWPNRTACKSWFLARNKMIKMIRSMQDSRGGHARISLSGG